jgi:hypothetical protein
MPDIIDTTASRKLRRLVSHAKAEIYFNYGSVVQLDSRLGGCR